MLQAAAEGGGVVRRSAPQSGELLKAGGQAGLLLRWDGKSMAERVHHDARVGNALRGLLPLLVAESQPQGMRKPVPVVLRAPGLAGRGCASRAAAVETFARGVRRGLGDEDGVVDPHDGVEGLRVEAVLDLRVRRIR